MSHKSKDISPQTRRIGGTLEVTAEHLQTAAVLCVLTAIGVLILNFN